MTEGSTLRVATGRAALRVPWPAFALAIAALALGYVDWLRFGHHHHGGGGQTLHHHHVHVGAHGHHPHHGPQSSLAADPDEPESRVSAASKESEAPSGETPNESGDLYLGSSFILGTDLHGPPSVAAAASLEPSFQAASIATLSPADRHEPAAPRGPPHSA